MKINFVSPDATTDYNLLYRWAKEFRKRIPGSTRGTQPDNQADANVFFNYALFRPGKTITIPVFTHREKDMPLSGIFDSVAKNCDWCFAQCQKTLDLLPPEKSSILSIGIDKQFLKKLRFGLPTQNKSSGRKRFEWGKRLQTDFPEIEIVFGGNILFKDMPAWYDSLDYVLITADNEGGPLGVPEGIARGKTVITTDVGWSCKYPVIWYKSYEELSAVINRLIIRDEVWDRGALQIIGIVRQLLKGE